MSHGQILDYLRWRGDLHWQASPLNDVDLLILAQLSYVNFDAQLGGEGRMDQRRSWPRPAPNSCSRTRRARRYNQTSYLWAGNRQLMELLSLCTRFTGVDMAGYQASWITRPRPSSAR